MSVTYIMSTGVYRMASFDDEHYDRVVAYYDEQLASGAIRDWWLD